MRFDGHWARCEDGVVRPLLRVDILCNSEKWHSFRMLIDTGADRTVLSADAWRAVDTQADDGGFQIEGVGGAVSAVRLPVTLRLKRSDGQPVTFRAEVAACREDAVLDMSVLGRDIIDMFTLIADRESDVLALLGGNHSYSIQSK